MGSEGEGDAVLDRQESIQKQLSVTNAGEGQLKRLTSKVQQEEWDKEIPEVGVVRGCGVVGAK